MTTPNVVDTINLDACTERLKDFKIATEYKYLITGAPVGVYLLPEFDDIRKLHGVIFVRGGFYKNGVFRFRIDLPQNYNDFNTHPLVTFTPPIFNPLVNMSTGKLELTCDESLKEWKPDQHFLVTCVTFLKKAFVTKSYDEYTNVPNEDARMMFNSDPQEFTRRATAAVNESLERLYDMQSATSPLVFTEPKPAHEEVIRDILLRHRKNRGNEEIENASGNTDETHVDEKEISIDSIDPSR